MNYYNYYYNYYYFIWLCSPKRAMASSFTRILEHTQRRAIVGRTPLGEWSARRRDLYLTTHNTHNRQTAIPPGGVWMNIKVTNIDENLLKSFEHLKNDSAAANRLVILNPLIFNMEIYTEWSKRLCAPDDHIAESYKCCSKYPPQSPDFYWH
jgi:hypothetical protein